MAETREEASAEAIARQEAIMKGLKTKPAAKKKPKKK